jgi:hypothetical protein
MFQLRAEPYFNFPSSTPTIPTFSESKKSVKKETKYNTTYSKLSNNATDFIYGYFS